MLITIGAERARCARPRPVGIEAVRDSARCRDHAAVVMVSRIGIVTTREVIEVVRAAQKVPRRSGTGVGRYVQCEHVRCRKISVITLCQWRETESR